jgi:hypothetical protein
VTPTLSASSGVGHATGPTTKDPAAYDVLVQQAVAKGHPKGVGVETLALSERPQAQAAPVPRLESRSPLRFGLT